VSDIAFDPAGTRIAIAGHDRRVRIRNLSSRGAPADLVHAGAVLSIDWSPDGRTIATAAADEAVRIWDLLDGSEEQRFVGRGIINVVRFAPDGRRLFVGGDDGVVRGFLLDRQELLDFAQSRVTRAMTAEECERYRTDRWCAG
jgi:WD40 repeat protein